MKKNRKAKVYDYKKHTTVFNNVEIPSNDIQYYGLHKEDGRVKVDIKRLKKLQLSSIKKEYLDAASQIPRHTTYFLPKKIHANDYLINQYRSLLSELRKHWYEIKDAFSNFKTPKAVYENVRLESITYGIDDLEEAEFKGILAGAKRQVVYNDLWISQCSQFIHQMATELMALMLRQCTYLGMPTKEQVTRNIMHIYLAGTVHGAARVENLKGFTTYDKFFLVWNLLKHNSEDLFNKVKERYPDMLLSNEYHNGELAQKYLKIGSDYIEEMLKDLEVFYIDLCEKFFGEDGEESMWNYDDYFIKKVNEEIYIYD